MIPYSAAGSQRATGLSLAKALGLIHTLTVVFGLSSWDTQMDIPTIQFYGVFVKLEHRW